MKSTRLGLLAVLAISAAACSNEVDTPRECYSPSQNVANALDRGARGCSCSEPGQAFCAHDRAVGYVAFFCEDGHWQSGFDGPCEAFAACDEVVDECPADERCVALPDGRYCPDTSPVICKPGHFRLDESPSCAPRLLSPAECKAARGIAVPERGRLLEAGCPGGETALGVIADWAEGGLCCERTPASCAPQKVRFEGSCEPAPRYFWQSHSCVAMTGCRCVGDDCSAGFASEAECESAYFVCYFDFKECVGLVANACSPDEYCAYRALGLCGANNGTSTCQPRPSACDDYEDPVCGCDGKTYANECRANAAGTGVRAFAPCSHDAGHDGGLSEEM
jgi:hypothetical protein